jgi:hypothetical protein
MVEPQVIHEQLKKIGFKTHGWGRAEAKELPHIILPDEEIYECVNGIYEGGFALLVATDVRVLLIDKKPLNYLTVEDLRFDMINELDYNHRLMGAYISISAGNKNLKFRSYNQPRLRKLISHVQHCMADSKKKESSHQQGQQQHLEQINQQLQAYLVAQYQQQQKMQEQLQAVQVNQQAGGAAPVVAPPPMPRPSPELSDYLYARSLLAQHQLQAGQAAQPQVQTEMGRPPAPADLYAAGMQEVYGQREPQTAAPAPLPAAIGDSTEINPLRLAYSTLATALRSRKFATLKR